MMYVVIDRVPYQVDTVEQIKVAQEALHVAGYTSATVIVSPWSSVEEIIINGDNDSYENGMMLFNDGSIDR